MEELSREEVKAMAVEVLEALGVEKGELSEEEREVVRKAMEEGRGKNMMMNEGK